MLGEEAARQRAHAHREEEGALVHRHHPPALGRRGDVGEDDLPRVHHERRARPRDEPRDDEGGEVGRVGAQEIAGGGDEAAERQHIAPTEPIRELAGAERR